MAWVVDTCVVLDIALADVAHGPRSLEIVEKKLSRGVVLCPISFIELTPQFGGSTAELEQFLEMSGIGFMEDWTQADTSQAALAFTKYIEARRTKGAPKRPVADIMIGAFACRYEGLITRNPKDFKGFFPKLKILVP